MVIIKPRVFFWCVCLCGFQMFRRANNTTVGRSADVRLRGGVDRSRYLLRSFRGSIFHFMMSTPLFRSGVVDRRLAGVVIPEVRRETGRQEATPINSVRSLKTRGTEKKKRDKSPAPPRAVRYIYSVQRQRYSCTAVRTVQRITGTVQ